MKTENARRELRRAEVLRLLISAAQEAVNSLLPLLFLSDLHIIAFSSLRGIAENFLALF